MMESYGSDFATLDFDFSCDDPVPCLLCDLTFEVNYDEQPLLQHLIAEHKVVIGETNEIADLRQYVIYWRKLRSLELTDYCVVFNTNGEPGSKLPSETFYLLCKKLPEDYRLRKTLSQLKLKYIVNLKEKERNDETFTRKCIWCREIISGGLANSFHHLMFTHGISLGNPDNIVNGATLLDILEDRLTNKLLCLCCEKTFKSHPLLWEHMRKKQHRSLNPKNKMYDKFYLLNYLEPGTPWQEAKQRQDTESEGRDTELVAEEMEECQWSDWQEDAMSSVTCLFCTYTTSKVPMGLYHHMKIHHQFDFQQSTAKLDFYQKVKMINYIRSHVQRDVCPMCLDRLPSPDALKQHMTEAAHTGLPDALAWDCPEFLIPVVKNDGILCYLEDDEVDGSDKIIPEEVNEGQDSILDDNTLREEIKETDESELCSAAMCLFCQYTVSGRETNNRIYKHMQDLHSFDFPEVMNCLMFYSQVKLINFIRWKTVRNECYYCGQKFPSVYSLEEHRVLANHLGIPDTSLFHDKKWLQPVLEEDGLLLRLREPGDSDDEDPREDNLCQEEFVYCEDIAIPPSILNDRAVRQELLENMRGLQIEENDSD